jgi:hypothetical protein
LAENIEGNVPEEKHTCAGMSGKRVLAPGAAHLPLSGADAGVQVSQRLQKMVASESRQGEIKPAMEEQNQ